MHRYITKVNCLFIYTLWGHMAQQPLSVYVNFMRASDSAAFTCKLYGGPMAQLPLHVNFVAQLPLHVNFMGASGSTAFACLWGQVARLFM